VTWEPKATAPASFNGIDALISAVHGDPVWGWMEHFVHLYPNAYIDTASFCAEGPSTVAALALTDFVNINIPGSSEWMDHEGELADKIRGALRDRLFGAMCQLPGVVIGSWGDWIDVSRSASLSTSYVDTQAPSGATSCQVELLDGGWGPGNNGQINLTQVHFGDLSADQNNYFHRVYNDVIPTGPLTTTTLSVTTWDSIRVQTILDAHVHVQIRFNVATSTPHDPTPQPPPDGYVPRDVPPVTDVTDLGPLLFDLELKMERALAFIQHTNAAIAPATPITFGDPRPSQPVDHAFPPGTPDVPNEPWLRPSNAVGLIVNCTTIPAGLARYGVEPLYYPSLVHLLPITALGALEGIRITRNPQVIQSLDRNVDSVVLDTQPGVVAEIQWLIAPF
jgi:hypothetical protein